MDSAQIINLYLQGLGAPAIADKLGITNYFVYKALRQNNICIRDASHKSQKYSIDEMYFANIDTPEKAYWLGFLYADGYVSKNAFGCALKQQDKKHLEKFKAAIGSTHPVKILTATGFSVGKPYCRLLIANQTISNQLRALGINENKSQSANYPAINSTLDRHFIRGYLDGDGSWAKSKKSASGFTMKICGTKSILESIAIRLRLPVEKVKPHKNIFILEKSGKDVLRLMNYLYTNADTYLERKYKRWFVAQSLLAERPIE